MHNESSEFVEQFLGPKSFQIGSESGITADFILRETCTNMCSRLDDLFDLFDSF